MGKGEIITRKINKCEIKGHCKNLYKKQGQTGMGQEALCLYCVKSQANISRHLQRKHVEMAELAYAFSFPPSSKERKSVTASGLRWPRLSLWKSKCSRTHGGLAGPDLCPPQLHADQSVPDHSHHWLLQEP